MVTLRKRLRCMAENKNKKKTLGVVLAGGKGNRFTGDTPKQFTKLCEKPVFVHSALAMEQSDKIDGIAVVVPAGYEETVKATLARFGVQKTVAVVCGGAERQDSVKSALDVGLKGRFDRILLHDAARPLLSCDVIERLCDALENHRAATAALPVTDTVAVTENGKTIAAVPDRSTLWQVQTPQGFCLYTLAEAYARLAPEILAACTDDCGVIRAFLPEEAVALVKGDRKLLKLTYPEDRAVLTALAGD